MIVPCLLLEAITLAALIPSAFASNAVHKLSTRLPENGLHLPIYRRRSSPLRKRDEQKEAIGLGDYLDLSYSIVMTVGKTTIPVILDTGSSDLWVISDECISNCSTSIPLYPQENFQSIGLDAELHYGDSQTGTHAFGLIGKDTVALAGLSLPNQYFAAINDTNTSVLDFGSALVFGLGFPIPESSVISAAVFKSDPTTPFLESYPDTGPFLPRLVAASTLAAPMFTVTLQRDTVDIGGNVGLLSIGELPDGVQNDSLTWMPVRGYTQAQGGLSGAPNEVYPMMWEIPIEDVLLDGQQLPRSTLSAPNISLSALIDSGNSLIRGPPDVMKAIEARLGSTFSCSTPHTLAFQIGGELFPVDPRDFIRQADENSVSMCVANLAPTDTPVEGDGFLFSWSLGDPFMKSALSSFYYGNLSYPSQDPPRIGFMSTVPADTEDKLRAAVQAAENNGGNLSATAEAAPTVPPPVTANSISPARETPGSRVKGTPNGASRYRAPLIKDWFVVLLARVIVQSMI